MAISGLVITLTKDAPTAEGAMLALRSDARLELGERFERRVAAVAETSGPEHDRALWDELRALRGVENVDVTFVGLDPANGSDAGLPEERRDDDP